MRTPSQTVGPFYSIGLCRRDDAVLAEDGVELTGQIVDGQEAPIADGMVEIWDPSRRLWGRSGTDGDGRFSFRVPAPDPYFDVLVFARGLLRHQWTRIYFPGADNSADPVFSSLEDAERLVARQEDGRFLFDIRMQGTQATVFFAH
jgi:protocatechuate 3,4-dioxygenase alpha subunit